MGITQATMKVLPSVLILAAHGQGMGEGYTAGEGKPIDDVLRRLKNLKKWGNECAENLIPDAKNNVLRKIYNFDRNAVRYYNNNNADFADVDQPEHWFDHIGVDRTISTNNPCECLWRVARGYTNFYSRGFGENGAPREKAKHMWSQLTKRLEKSYGCDLSNMGYGDPKPTDPPTEPPTEPYPTGLYPTVPTDPPTEPPAACPVGWTKFDDEDRCFKTKCQKTPMSFDAAQGQCTKWGSMMTMVKSEVQNGQVADSGPVGGLTDEGVQLAGGIWINGHDHEEGTWTYTDGSAMSYTNWAEGQPNDGNPNIAQDCLWMNFLTKGEWDDMNCVNVRSVHCVSCSKGME